MLPKVFCLFKDQLQHIIPVENNLINNLHFIYNSTWNCDDIRRVKPAIVIGINEHHLKIAQCYEAAAASDIPTLTLQDGVLEWRYLFDNPMFGGNESGVPLHQPIIADKYACIGPWWAGLIAAMGNEKKVEVTGMPKMDALGNRPLSAHKKQTGVKKILVMTAAKPWFREEHRPVVLKMLQDLKYYFERRDDIEVIWRVTKLLDKDLNVEGAFRQKESSELAAQLEECDAVISTTSTAMVETLLMGKPLARLDYFNTPPLFPAVWNITHPEHIDDTVNALLAPTREQCFWQEVFKSQVIGHIGNGADRVAELILKMIEYKKTNPGKPLPPNMLQTGFTASIKPHIVSESLYPERESLTHPDMDWLKAKLIRLERENDVLKQEASKKRLGSLLLSFYNKIKKR